MLYHVGMRRSTFRQQLRQAILTCGKSRYRIFKDTGIDQAVLARFINETAGLSLETVDQLCEYLELNLVAGDDSPRGRKPKGR